MAQAIGAKYSQCFLARQNISLFQAVAAGATRTETRVVADVARDGRRLRLDFRLPAAAAHRVFVDDTHVLQQWEPSRRLVLVEPSHEETPEAQRRILGLLHDNYRCLPLCEQVVNGLPCDLVVIRPRRLQRGGKRIWVDRLHHAILRTEEYDTTGRRCYLSFYETIRFVRRVTPSLFRLAGLGQVRHIPRLTCSEAGFRAAFSAAGVRGRLPAWLPPGYAMIGCALAAHPGGGRAAILRYGDGLQTFSVFQERGSGRGDVPTSGLALHSQIAHYGQRIWELSAQGVSLTVIGDAMLPDSLGRDVLLSFMPKTEATLRARLARDFGPGALSEAASLRARGWGYEEIVSLDLFLRAHPGRAHTASVRLADAQGWAPVMSGLHADSSSWEQQARSWIADALHTP